MSMAVSGGDCLACSAERQEKSLIIANSTAISKEHSGANAVATAFTVSIALLVVVIAKLAA
jgi:hypothetical protein